MYAPAVELAAFGSLQREAVIPDAIPLSSGDTRPMSRDWPRGFERFIKKTLTV